MQIVLTDICKTAQVAPHPRDFWHKVSILTQHPRGFSPSRCAWRQWHYEKRSAFTVAGPSGNFTRFHNFVYSLFSFGSIRMALPAGLAKPRPKSVCMAADLRRNMERQWCTMKDFPYLKGNRCIYENDYCSFAFSTYAFTASKLSWLMTCSIRQASSLATDRSTPKCISQPEMRVCRS